MTSIFVDYEVRVAEVGDKKKKMKYYTSTLLKDNINRFTSILDVADTCREELWANYKETMEKFQNWKTEIIQSIFMICAYCKYIKLGEKKHPTMLIVPGF